MVLTMPPTARVWVYQSSRPLASEEISAVEQALGVFVRQWTSHNTRLHAAGEVRHARFIILAVDESQSGASGCSIDKSVAFMKSLQASLGIDLFDRMCFTYLEGEEVRSASRESFAASFARGEINDSTLVFDTLVDTAGKLEKAFIKPLGESWHKRLI
jgi:hypothetical protein